MEKEIYEKYQKEYKETVIMIKSGTFYHLYDESAKVVWYFFDYVYKNSSLGFGVNGLNKVTDELKKYNIGYIVLDKDTITNQKIINDSSFNTILSEANKLLEKKEKIKNLFTKIENILDNDFSNVTKIEKFIETLEKD